jgi:hypothetical protein
MIGCSGSHGGIIHRILPGILVETKSLQKDIPSRASEGGHALLVDRATVQ